MVSWAQPSPPPVVMLNYAGIADEAGEAGDG